jgi:hypothetical protein
MTSITAVDPKLVEIEEIINSTLSVVDSTGTGVYAHDVKPGYDTLDTGYLVRLYYLLGVRLSPHELKLIDKRLSKIGLIANYIGVGSVPDNIDGPYDKVFLHLHLSQLSETPSLEEAV